MKELYYKAELLDDIVLSQRTATAGDHKTLDYIPGSTILGSFAARFYEGFGEKAWDFFHTSKICFCNAYPKINETRSIPMPLAIHSEKVARKGNENLAFNFLFDKVKEEGIQYRQQRAGYVLINNDKFVNYSVEKTSRMRTAIDARTGSAAKSQLYGYESMNAGQVFVGKIQWNDSLDSTNELEKIKKVFADNEVLHIGRSKTASYGRVKVSLLENPKKEIKVPSGNKFSVMAISDLVLLNPITGKPELKLFSEHLGLNDSWKLDSSHTFVRPNVIYQYNGHRRELEAQKTLISKGSVFTFESDKDLTEEEKRILQQKFENGIGGYKNQGYGEICLFDFSEKFEKESAISTKENQTKTTPQEEEWFKCLEEYVFKYIKKFETLCKSIKAHKIEARWPSTTQWANVRNAVKENHSIENLKKALFEGENPVIKMPSTTVKKSEKDEHIKNKNSKEEWNFENGRGDSLRKWLMKIIDSEEFYGNDEMLRQVLYELARRCPEKTKKFN